MFGIFRNDAVIGLVYFFDLKSVSKLMLILLDKMGRSGDLSMDLRKTIIKLYLEGNSFRQIGNTIGRHYSTVYSIIKKYTSTGDLGSNHQQAGRPKLLTPREERNLIASVAENPKISSSVLCSNILETAGKKVCPQTVRNCLHSAGYHGRVARRKPYVSEINKQKRLAFARLHINEPDSFWENVIFSDESKFNIFGYDGPPKVWRKVNEAMKETNLIPTVKHGGGNVMVWGCIAAAGTGNMVFVSNKMDKHIYKSILEENLLTSATKLGLDHKTFMFQQDNDPKHSSYLVQEWLIYHCKQLKTPPQSPDLNPIEHVWDLLEKRIRKHRITSKESLKSALKDEWGEIDPNETNNLVKSMRRRLEAVIKAKGGPTKY